MTLTACHGFQQTVKKTDQKKFDGDFTTTQKGYLKEKQIHQLSHVLKRGAQLEEVSLDAKMLYRVIALNWLVRII